MRVAKGCLKRNVLNTICLFAKVIVITILSGYTIINIVEGPFQSYLRNTTMIRRHEIQLSGRIVNYILGLHLTLPLVETTQPIVWPDLSITTMPFVKNFSQYRLFMSKLHSDEFAEEKIFDASVEEIFYTNPKDFILGLNMAGTYEATVSNLSRIPIEPPYVRTVLNDFLYNGYIGVISLEAIRQFLIREGEITINDINFKFDLMLAINVSKAV